jgi:hypothetical protein
MKFLVPNYSCLQNPWLGGYRPQIPVLSVFCPQLNLLNPPPPNKIPGYATALHSTSLQAYSRIIAVLTTDMIWTAKFEAEIQTETLVPSDRLVTADRYRTFFSVSIRMNDLADWDRITEFHMARLMVFKSKLLSELVGIWEGVTGQRKLRCLKYSTYASLLIYPKRASLKQLKAHNQFVTLHQMFPRVIKYKKIWNGRGM